MKLLKPFSVFLFLVVVSAQAIAQTPTPSPTPLGPTDHNVPGEVRKWIFKDGREMTLMVRDAANTLLTFPFGVATSTCSMGVVPRAKCEFGFPVRITQLTAHWTKHSDPTKIGTVVKHHMMDINHDITVSTFTKRKNPKQYKTLPDTQIACDDYTWLAGTKEAPEKLQMSSLSSESMTMNPETGQQENRTNATIYEPFFQKLNAQTLAMKSSGEWVMADEEAGDFAIVDATVHHVVLDSDKLGNACQISLKPDLSTAQRKFEELLKNATGTYVPFVSNPDFFMSFVKQSLEYYVQSEEKYFE